MRRRNRRGSGAKRLTDWVPYLAQDQLVVAGAAGLITFALLDDTDLEEKDGKLTVARVVGDVWWHDGHLRATSVTQTMRVAHGIIVADLDNAGQVTARSPFILTDAEAPWMYRWQGLLWQDTAGVTLNAAGAKGPGWAQHVHIDVTVARKIEERSDLIFAVEAMQPLNSAGDACFIDFQLRTLVQLS